MKRTFVTVACAVVLTSAISVAAGNTKLGVFGVDAVSAATTEAPAPAPTPAPAPAPKTTSKPAAAPRATTSRPAAAQSATYSVGTDITRLLTLGSNGSDVKGLQTMLNNNGYKLTVDGFFGSLTEAAVKDYQGKNGLTVDGIVGPKTIEKLKSAPAEIAAELAGIKGLLVVGSQGNDVKLLQAALNNNGYNLAVDGIFGSQTLNALKDFQKSNGLTVDGLVGPNTFAKLSEKVAVVSKPASTASTPAPTASTPAPTASVPSTPSTPAPTASAPASSTTTPVDAETGASQVNDEAAFEKAISKNNTNYMIIVNKDLTFTKDLVIESGVQNGAPNRSIAPCHETADGKVDKEYTITAPSIVINGPNIKIEDGIVKGDIYVRSTGFKLTAATINGNIHFATQALKDAFVQDATTKVTGQVDVKAYTNSTIPDATTTTGNSQDNSSSGVDASTGASKGGGGNSPSGSGSDSGDKSNPGDTDATTGASQVPDAATFEKNVNDPASDYMQIVNEDISFDHDVIVVSGTKSGAPNRSIAPCLEDTTTKQITKQYTITVPNLILAGKTEKVEDGIVKGNVYVLDTGFTLPSATIEGNLYFENQALLDAYNALDTKNKGTVTGEIAVKPYISVDAETGASQVNDEATFESNVTNPNSDYMQIVNKDLTFDHDITVVSGSSNGKPNRSIAPCLEITSNKVIAKQYTITIPNLIFSGKTEKVEDGIVKGNVYVQDIGFTLPSATIQGNLYFASQDLLNTYNALDASKKGTVTGEIAVKTYVPAAAIDISAIDGVTAPVTDATPAATIVETTEYTGTIAWSGNPTTFAADTPYTATITITPKEGYTLAGVGANFFTVAGATSVTNAADSGIVTAVFPTTTSSATTVTTGAATTLAVSPTTTGSATILTAVTETAESGDTIEWAEVDTDPNITGINVGDDPAIVLPGITFVTTPLTLTDGNYIVAIEVDSEGKIVKVGKAPITGL